MPSGIEAVTIIRNDEVLVEDFVPVMQAALEARGIRSRLVAQAPASTDGVTATYTALRSWDFVPYLSTADVWFRRGGRQIGHLHYHLRGKGGLSPAKFGSTATKLAPAYAQLLKVYDAAGSPNSK